ncbi:hypothetical protein GS928_26265 [Rhodococcus hoagii]|nr:hypothetical protein [Prescottella equi]
MGTGAAAGGVVVVDDGGVLAARAISSSSASAWAVRSAAMTPRAAARSGRPAIVAVAFAASRRASRAAP